MLILVITLRFLRWKIFVVEDDQARWATVNISYWTDQSDWNRPARLGCKPLGPAAVLLLGTLLLPCLPLAVLMLLW